MMMRKKKPKFRALTPSKSYNSLLRKYKLTSRRILKILIRDRDKTNLKARKIDSQKYQMIF
jgi:Mor family transcriptional regulator